ncbi:kunitz-like toxin PcKuz3 [Halichoeres trimaculatus]|uniref:kunitz-like toxin PcKuz3 n=1 Tax=Halichoeres trimaculatus TaxID=147232 RepID=UPI003D9E6A63
MMKAAVLFCLLVLGWTWRGSTAPCARREICLLAPETGPCKAFAERFFFNSTSNTCEIFVYGGCGGNKNKFLSMEKCMKRCNFERGQDSDEWIECGP